MQPQPAAFDCELQPSLSISTKKPSGMRGMVSSYGLHQGHGAPAAPQGQAFGPLQGLPGWASQTQPMSWQRVQLIIALAYHWQPPFHFVLVIDLFS
jgi:hypothetical protein